MSLARPSPERLHPARAALLALALAPLLAVMAGCAALRTGPQAELAPAEAWSRFRAGQQALAASPGDFSLKASFYFSSAGRTNRTILDFWGNRDYPLRLNIRAGVGATLALMREDADGLLVFHPTENKAYRHSDSRTAVSAMGLDLPFNLRDLAALLTGPATRLLPAEYASVRQEGGLYVYAMSQDLPVAEVRLHPDGRLASFSGHGAGLWSIAVEAYRQVGGASVPERLAMAVPPSQSATLRVRSLDLRASPWPPAALSLELPPGAETIIAPPASHGIDAAFPDTGARN